MAVIELTKENIDSTIETNEFVFIGFFAPDCEPSDAFQPIFEEVSDAHPELLFAKCDTVDQIDLARMFQIDSIPTLVVFRESVLVFGQSGVLPADTLEDLIGKVITLDMKDVHQKVKTQSQEPMKA